MEERYLFPSMHWTHEEKDLPLESWVTLWGMTLTVTSLSEAQVGCL